MQENNQLESGPKNSFTNCITEIYTYTHFLRERLIKKIFKDLNIFTFSSIYISINPQEITVKVILLFLKINATGGPAKMLITVRKEIKPWFK